jgi:hypothetical protein
MSKLINRLLLSAALTASVIGSSKAQCNGALVANGPIPGYLAPNAATRRNASDAIAQLTFANLYRAPPFRITVGNVRLDAQGNTGTHANWQAQVGNSSIAAALIANPLGAANTTQLRAYVQRQARNALVQSLNAAQIEQLNANGACP